MNHVWSHHPRRKLTNKWIVGGAYLLAAGGHVPGLLAQTAAGQAAPPPPPGTQAPADSGTASAANSSSDVLQLVVVTAERRVEDLQHVAATVTVLQGSSLLSQGRITTQQILEDVPNVVYAPPNQVAGGGAGGGDNPNGNITIRGVQSTQQTAGIAGPSATASYVDGVFQGIGGDYDVNRVEVLAGPQGTLYGRSATGGVVAFHTNEPVLDQFNGDVYGEYGTAALVNSTAVVNLPVGDQLAIRVAAHDYQRNGWWWDPEGGSSRTEEGRVEALWQPTSQAKLLLSASTELIDAHSSGQTPVLSAPTIIDYSNWPAQALTPNVPTASTRFNQYAATFNYDFGGETLTYEGSMHTYSRNGFSGYYVSQSGVQDTQAAVPLDQFNTQELRLASDPDSKLTWLVGASFYSQLYRYSATSLQEEGYEGGPGIAPGTVDPNPAATPGTFMFSQVNWGGVKDYGVFTEETYPVTDSLRLTAGLRYDKTEVDPSAGYVFNQNLDGFLSSLSPPQNANFSLVNAESSYDNVTYKLRAAYDVTPRNMVYGMVSTGFLPGNTQVTPVVNIVNAFMGKPVTVGFKVLPFSQERLTAYEVGTKNRLLGDTFQINGDVYYYDYQGYQEAVNTQPNSPIPAFATVSVPVRMMGAELEGVWLPTGVDRLTLMAGTVNARITSFPGVTSQYIGQKTLPGVVPVSVSLIYEHTFDLPAGSLLVPRVEARYMGGDYVEVLTPEQLVNSAYDHQAAYEIYDFDLTWNSPSGMYTATAYARNIGDTIYKTYLNGGASFAANTTTVIPSDPRTFGVSFNVHF